DRRRFRISQAGPTVPAVVAVFLVCYVLPVFADAAIPFAAALGAIIVLWWLDGREEIEIDGTRVRCSRQMMGISSTREIALREIAGIDSRGFRLTSGRRVPIARNLGHRDESL